MMCWLVNLTMVKNPKTHFCDQRSPVLYQITATVVLDAYNSLILVANHPGITETQIKARIQEMIAANTPGNAFMLSVPNYHS